MALSGHFWTDESYKKNLCFEFKWTGSQSVGGNYTDISWQLIHYNQTGGASKNYCGNITVVVNGQTFTAPDRKVYRHGDVALSGNTRINHNEDGSGSFNAYAEAAIYNYGVNSRGSGSFTLDIIPRYAHITSAPNFNDENYPTIYYSNPVGNTVSELSATIWIGHDIVKRDLPKNGSSYQFILADNEVKELRKACANSNSTQARFYIGTKIGNGATHWEYVERTYSIVNATPTISPTVFDNNQFTIGLTGNNQFMVKGYSNASFNIGSSALKEATISQDYISNGSQHKYATSGVLNKVESNQFYFWTKDSRGNTKDAVILTPFKEYIEPTITFEAKPELVGTKANIKITAKGNFYNNSFGKVSNTCDVYFKYKRNSGSYSGWIKMSVSKSGNSYTATYTLSGFNYQDTITIQCAFDDKIHNATSGYGEVYTPERVVKTKPVFDWGNADFNFNVPVNVDGRLDCKSLYVNGSAYQPPKPVITPNDYVIASGTTSGWGWRKWNSGIGECWSITQLRDNQLSCSGGWGSCYYGSPILSYQYPITFTETPQEIANIRCSNDILFYRRAGGNTKTTSASYGLFAPSSVRVNYAFIEYYVIGKYK